jgi:hypothetical protein
VVLARFCYMQRFGDCHSLEAAWVIHAVAQIVSVYMWLHALETLGRFRLAFMANCVRVWVGHYGVVYGYIAGSRCMQIREEGGVSW